MKLHKAITVALAYNRTGWRNMPLWAHVRFSGDPVKLSVVTVDGLLEIQTDYPGVGDFIVDAESLRGFKPKDKLAVIDGRLHRVNGLEIPLAQFEFAEDLPMIDTSGFSDYGAIVDFSKAWNLACNHAATDPSRYALNNVAIQEVGTHVGVCATNGKILFTTMHKGDFSKAILVPLHAAQMIGRTDGDLIISIRQDVGEKVTTGWIKLEATDVQLFARLAEGEFPNSASIFHTSGVDVQFSIDAAAWKAAWTAVKAHPDSRAQGVPNGIVDVFEGRVTIRPPQKGDKPAAVNVPAEVLGSARRTFRLNCDYALTATPGDWLSVVIHSIPRKTDLWGGPVHIMGELGQCLIMTMSIEDCDDKDIEARVAASRELKEKVSQ